ncbi:MAG: oligosaccharide flippase family protein [Clostridia bacterium]|nr:oligosaccharide flippase family protein [Clostridia bacterium]
MKKNQIKLGVILSYISLFVTNIVGLVYTPIMLKYMGQSEYGLYSLVASIIGYLTVLDLGFGNAIIVYTSKYIASGKKEEESKLHGMFLIIYTIIGIIAAVIGIILFFNIENLFGATMTSSEISKAKIMMLILTFNLAITFPLSIYGSILTAHEEFIYSKIINIIRQLLNPVIMIPLLLMGYKSIAMTLVVTILNIVCLVANVIYCNKKLKTKMIYKKPNKSLLKEIFGYSAFVFLCIIVDKANWSVDQFILGSVVGTIAVAIYTVASQINNIYLSFSNSISGVLIPKVTKMIENKSSDKEVSDIFIKTGRLQMLVMGLVMTGFIIFGKEFIYLWAGKDYGTSYLIACILMLPVTIPLIQNLGIAILQAKNMIKFRSLVYAGIAILNILASIPLAKLYGGVGSAIGTAISLIIGNGIIMNIYYYKKAKIDIPRFWKNIIRMLIPICVIFFIGYILNVNNTIYSWSYLILKVVIYAFIYFVTVYLFSMNGYEKNIVMKPMLKIKEKIMKGR